MGGPLRGRRSARRPAQGAAGPPPGQRGGRGRRLGRPRGTRLQHRVERHRRYQSAKTRELLRTLETLRRMRDSEFGMRNAERGMGNGEGGMADDKCQMADDECQVADDECQVEEGELQVAGGELKMGDEPCEVQAGGCDEGQSNEPMTEGSSGPVVGHDSQRVIEDATGDKIVTLSHEGAHAAGQPGQGDGVGQFLPDDVTTPQKAPNKANFKSKQRLESEELKSETAGAEGRKQSQSSQGETRKKPRSRDGRPARQSGRRPVASEAEGSELLRAAGVPPLRRSDDLDSPGDGQMKGRTHRGSPTVGASPGDLRSAEEWPRQVSKEA